MVSRNPNLLVGSVNENVSLKLRGISLYLGTLRRQDILFVGETNFQKTDLDPIIEFGFKLQFEYRFIRIRIQKTVLTYGRSTATPIFYETVHLMPRTRWFLPKQIIKFRTFGNVN